MTQAPCTGSNSQYMYLVIFFKLDENFTFQNFSNQYELEKYNFWSNGKNNSLKTKKNKKENKWKIYKKKLG